MNMDAWRVLMVAALSFNAAAGFAYRVHRYYKGGPLPDVVGQAILGGLLGTLAAAGALEWGWARWVALAYAVVFGAIVMPVWVLAVLIPLRPRALDYSFTVGYWVALVAIATAAIAQ